MPGSNCFAYHTPPTRAFGSGAARPGPMAGNLLLEEVRVPTRGYGGRMQITVKPAADSADRNTDADKHG